MKTYFFRFKTGLYTAVQSFGLAWRHKELLVYTLCASGTSFIASIILYNLLNQSLPEQIDLGLLLKEALCVINPACSHEFGHTLALVLTSFASLIVANFFLTALFHRAAHILTGENHSFGESLKKTSPKLLRIIAWSALALCIEQIVIVASSLSSTFLSLGALLAFISIHFATFFVLPIIAYTQETLKGALFLSFSVTKNRFIEIIGGGTWFVIIAGLFFIPLSLFWGYWQIKPLLTMPLVLLSIGLTQLSVRIFLSTSFTLFKGLIYSDHQRENTTLEDIYRFPWPPM